VSGRSSHELRQRDGETSKKKLRARSLKWTQTGELPAEDDKPGRRNVWKNMEGLKVGDSNKQPKKFIGAEPWNLAFRAGKKKR